MAAHRRGPWSNAEDNYLMQLVQSHGALNWVRIAQTLGSRTPKQCRERYHQNLKPTLNHEPITPEEGMLIERLVQELGKRWAEIARRLHGRSDNAVKNWWNGSQNRRKRLDRRRAVVHPTGLSSQPFAHQDTYRTHIPGQTPTHAFDEDERCPRIPPLPVIRPSGLPLPRSTCPRSPALDSHALHRHVLWGEAPLPSPCSSEPAESDTGSNYTTSPAGTSRGLDQAHYELPPLRTWDTVNTGRARLPSLSSLTPDSGHSMPYPRIQQPTSQDQLITAPNSPSQSQRRFSESSKGDRNPKMRLAALLG
ncbi:hypothetical protein HIM_04809 [Hirsutella minnesotensis 3608]|uniref:Myb-like DNA-binding protein myb-1 n=1 Tax=Hirsutella minnesotensis 3608 TaxID=1043627 RepID=A0A0F8A0W3_9HYPO|nr:hypothetical protein HIM_04809 [Hirsutella minnesotensis 3608]